MTAEEHYRKAIGLWGEGRKVEAHQHAAAADAHVRMDFMAQAISLDTQEPAGPVLAWAEDGEPQ